MNALRQWYAQLPERDRLILLRGGGLALALILVFGVWLPLEDAIDRERKRHRALQQTLAEMRDQAAEVARLRRQGPSSGTTPAVAKGSLIGTVESAAAHLGLARAIREMTPEGSERLRLRMEALPFADLLTLIERLSMQHGLRIEQMLVTPRDDAGIVDARLTVRRPGD